MMNEQRWHRVAVELVIDRKNWRFRLACRFLSVRITPSRSHATLEFNARSTWHKYIWNREA